MSHNHNLSVNSINSIIEPTTPPNHLNGTGYLSGANGSLRTVSGGAVNVNQTNNNNNGNINNNLHQNQSTPILNHHHGKSGSISSNIFNQNINFVTPPSSNGINNKSGLWDSSNKLNHNLNLPNFNIDGNNTNNQLHQHQQQQSNVNDVAVVTPPHEDDQQSQHQANKSLSTSPVPPINGLTSSSTSTSTTPAPAKIDKEYLASINKIPLIQIKSEILKLSKDQYGCRFLQKKIDENLIPNFQTRQANFEIIFEQINPYLYELIIDPFGNYLIQKLIGYCSQTNLNLCLEILQFNLFQISINQHGTRALQKIIDNLTLPYQLSLLIKGLKPFIIKLIKDLNGNHVIQKILNKYNPQDCQFIYDSIIDDLYIVATHKHGCCVLQKCLNHVDITQLNQFSNAILNFNNFTSLINDQFGNYVLQYLISLNIIDINLQIYGNFLKFGIENLCNLKFSSNVIEKFLKNCYNREIYSQEFSKLKLNLCHQILIQDLNKLINDPYGNYVIQTLIDIIIHSQVDYIYNSQLVEQLHKLLPPQSPSMENDYSKLSNLDLQILIIKYWFLNCKIISSFGKRIQSKINNVINETSPSSNASSSSSIKNNRSSSSSSLDSSGKFAPNPLQQHQHQGSTSSTSSAASSSSQQHYRNSRTMSNDSVLKPSVNRNLSLPVNMYNYEQSKQQQQQQQALLQQQQQQQHLQQGQPSNVAAYNDFTINEFPFGFPPQQQQQQHQQQQQFYTPLPSASGSHQHKMSLSDNVINQPQPMTHYTTTKPQSGGQYPTPPPMNYQYQQSVNGMPQQQQQQQAPPQQQQQQQLGPSAIPNRPNHNQYATYNGPVGNNNGASYYYNARTPSFSAGSSNNAYPQVGAPGQGPNGSNHLNSNNSTPGGPILESAGGNVHGGWM
ncbi:armadillo-type protein [Scheffersomyces coipomensis]|uniref:armadillo-type protein n=1 Tax=Scheffersomyces coipomensis TaxID=1788519 RepID=UPI00315DDECB